MSRMLVLHPEAAQELQGIYDYLRQKAGEVVAIGYVRGVQGFLRELCDYPERGTVRGGSIQGLRIIGYRRTLAIAFAVSADRVMVCGLYYAGRNVDLAQLVSRHGIEP